MASETLKNRCEGCGHRSPEWEVEGLYLCDACTREPLRGPTLLLIKLIGVWLLFCGLVQLFEWLSP